MLEEVQSVMLAATVVMTFVSRRACSQLESLAQLGDRHVRKSYSEDRSGRENYPSAPPLRGSLEVFDLADPAGQRVPSGENLGHQLHSLALVRWQTIRSSGTPASPCGLA
jgi:hypothetical protein